MGMHFRGNMPVGTAKPKSFHFDLPKDVEKNLKHAIDSIIKQTVTLRLSIQ